MINKLTKSDLRRLLDKNKYQTAVDDDGDYYTILDADEDFDHNVIIYFMVNEESSRLSMLGHASEFKVDNANLSKAILTCNNYNHHHFIPNSYVDTTNNIVAAQRTWFIDKPVSEEYLMEEIKTTIGSIWTFFCKFNGE